MAYYNPYIGQSYSPNTSVGNWNAGYQRDAAPAIPVTQNNDVIWVQGEVGARAYPVAPGHMAVLMDSEDSVFYIKAVDSYGMPAPLRKFRFTEIVDERQNMLSQAAAPSAQQSQKSLNPAPDMSNYITKEEFERRLDELTK